MAKKLKRWTEDELDTLRTMYHAGITHKEIGRVLGRSASACQQRAHYLGLTKPAADKKYVSDTLTIQEMRDYANEISSDVEPEQLEFDFTPPTTWIGRIKRLLGLGD